MEGLGGVGGLLGGRLKKDAKKGRRAGGGAPGGGMADGSAMSSVTAANTTETPPSRRKGGWADTSESKSQPIDNNDDQRFKVVEDNSQLDDIPVIPDMEELQEQEVGNQVAAPPSIAGTRLDTFRKLDNELLQQTGLHVLDGDIDLSVLTDLLVPESEVLEEDKHWTWDHLFTEVSSEIHTELENNQKVAESSGILTPP